MDCVFCAIIKKEIPSSVVYEDSDMLCIRDINPQAPVHVIVFPKKHIVCANDISGDNIGDISKIFLKIPEIAAKLGLSNGYRIINNCGSDACQSVKHIHFHILGGKQLPETMA